MGSPRKLDALIAVAALLASAASLAASPPAKSSGGPAPASRIYCCDVGGRRMCGDILPESCYAQTYREMGSDGRTKREVAAPLTREEIARRKADEERRKVEEQAEIKQRRLDGALLNAYASVEEIDQRRDREIAEVERSIESARQHQKELQTRRERLAQEADFYKGKELPRDVANGLKAIDKELGAYDAIFAAKKTEIEALRSRFAADRSRYLELKAGRSGAR